MKAFSPLDILVTSPTSGHTTATFVAPSSIVMAPMTRRRASADCEVSEASAEYYARRAAGGVGLIITEGVHVNPTDAVDRPASPQCRTQGQLAAWKRVVERCKERSRDPSCRALLCMQLWHTGLYSRDPIGPSDGIDLSSETRSVPLGRAASLDDIARIANDFADTARSAVEVCGFDLVEIHGAHGYFVDSFASPKLNLRNETRIGGGSEEEEGERFGGDAHRRSALAGCIVRAVRHAVGDAVPIGFRFSQWTVTDYAHIKFADPTELRIFVEHIVHAGVNVIHVSTRRVLEPAFPNHPLYPTRSLAAWTRTILCEEIHRPDVVVIGVGSVSLARAFGEGAAADTVFEVTNPAPALEALERGDFNALAVGRGLLADPDWVAKVSSDPTGVGWRTLVPYSTALLEGPLR